MNDPNTFIILSPAELNRDILTAQLPFDSQSLLAIKVAQSETLCSQDRGSPQDSPEVVWILHELSLNPSINNKLGCGVVLRQWNCWGCRRDLIWGKWLNLGKITIWNKNKETSSTVSFLFQKLNKFNDDASPFHFSESQVQNVIYFQLHQSGNRGEDVGRFRDSVPG